LASIGKGRGAHSKFLEKREDLNHENPPRGKLKEIVILGERGESFSTGTNSRGARVV